MLCLDTHIIQRTPKTKYSEKPNDDNDNNYHIENGFDSAFHRDVVIDKPKDNACAY